MAQHCCGGRRGPRYCIVQSGDSDELSGALHAAVWSHLTQAAGPHRVLAGQRRSVGGPANVVTYNNIYIIYSWVTQ